MIRIIKGEVGNKKTSRILDEIKEKTLAHEKCFLIVPEQQALAYEQMFCRELPASASLYFEVTNFSRLANTVFRTYGGISYNYSTSVEKALVMWRTLGELLPTLHDNRGEVDAGRVKKMISAVGELKASSVGAEELSLVASQISDTALRERLEDLCAVYSLYGMLLNEKFTDQSDDLERLRRILRENRFFDGTTVFIDSFTSFTEQEYLIIAEISKQCDVVVTLPLPTGSDKRLCFEEVAGCEKRLRMIAGVGNVHSELIEDELDTLPPVIAHVGSSLFLTAKKDAPVFEGEDSGHLSIVEAPTPFAEADFVASDIAKRVYEGARYKDFCIIARDASSYEGVIDSALRKYGIPFFMSVKTDISAYAAIKLIYSAYSICTGNFNRGDLITYMKCGLCGISDHECDEFELYTEQWNLSGAAFYSSDDWNMRRGGYSAYEDEGEGEFLARINKTRRAVIEPLYKLSDSIKGIPTVTEHCHALYRFLCEIGLQKSLSEHGKALCKSGSTQEGEHTLRLYQIICDSLDRLVSTLPDTRVSADGFSQLLKITFNELDIGRIPATSDALMIGSADMLRTSAPYVYLFGVNAGEFPATVSEKSFFTQNDRELLAEAGIAIEGDLSEKASRELFCFYRAFCSAQSSVTILYSLTDTAFSTSERASVVNDILHFAGKGASLVKYNELDEDELLWKKQGALSVLGSMKDENKRDALREILSGDPEYARRAMSASLPISNMHDRVSPEIMKQIYPADISSTQSRLEKYAKCSFSYFCHYVLKLDENKKASIDFAGMGTFVHAVLENLFLRLEMTSRKLQDLSDDELKIIIEEITSDYVKSICPAGREQSPRMKHLFYRLKSSAVTIVKNLQKEFSQSEFSPRFFEFKIGEGDCPSIDIKTKTGKTIKLHGIVDRIDTYSDGDNVYVRVVDYKSGPKKFSLELIEKGLNLQMLIYLFSLWKSDSESLKERLGCKENGEILPAGILYMPTKIDNITVSSFREEQVERARQSAFARNGLLLEDEGILRAMEKNLESNYIPVTLNKKGELAPKNALASLERMGELLEQTKSVIAELCDELQSGDAKACPLEITSATLPCDYCSVRAVCRKY